MCRHGVENKTNPVACIYHRCYYNFQWFVPWRSAYSYGDTADLVFTAGHNIDVIMTTMASQITSLTVVYSTVYSDADQRKHQKLCVIGLCVGNSPGPVNSPHKGPVMRKMFPFDDVIKAVYLTWRLLCAICIFADLRWIWSGPMDNVCNQIIIVMIGSFTVKSIVVQQMLSILLLQPLPITN